MQHRAYVLGAVGEAVACSEALINQLDQDAAEGTAGAADGLRPDMVRLVTEPWRGTNSGKARGDRQLIDLQSAADARIYRRGPRPQGVAWGLPRSRFPLTIPVN